MSSCSQAEFLKEVSHTQAKGFIMLVDGSEVVGFPPPFKVAGCGQQRLDDLVAQNQQRGQGSQAAWSCLVPTGEFNLVDQFVGAEFFQIVGGAPRSIFEFAWTAQGTNLPGKIGGRKPSWERRQGQDGLGHAADSKLVEIDPADSALAEPGGQRHLLQSVVADETDIHIGKRLEESFQNLAKASHDAGEVGQGSSAAQRSGIVYDDFDAEDALA